MHPTPPLPPPVPSLLERVTSANSKLLEGINDIFSYSEDGPSSLPQMRTGPRSEPPTPQSIDNALSIVNDFTELLVEIEAYLRRIRNTVTLRSTSFGTLSIEVFQHIIDFTVSSPQDRETIITLSHVSHGFRSAVLGMPHLFVNADHRYWPTSAINEWYARAGSHPLTIAFETDHLEAFHTVLEVSDTHLEMASTISVRVMEEGGDSEIGLGSWFFRPLPMLHTLCFNDERLKLPYPSFLSLLSYNLPSLHSLYLPNTSLSVIGGPFANLSSLGILAWDPDTLTSLAHVLSNTRSLLHLTLYANAGQVMGLDDYTPPPIQPLDSLLSLRLTGYSGSDVENIHFILELFAAPNLQTLELVNCELRILSELATQQLSGVPDVVELIMSQLYWSEDELPEFFQPLYDGGVPFSKLRTLAVEDLQLEEMIVQDLNDTSYWPSLFTLVKASEGKLRKLVLSFTLPEAQQQSLLGLGYNIEVTSDFELNEHGFPKDVF